MFLDDVSIFDPAYRGNRSYESHDVEHVTGETQVFDLNYVLVFH